MACADTVTRHVGNTTMSVKASWDVVKIKTLYDLNWTYNELAAAAGHGTTSNAIKKYAMRNWPERQCDIEANDARQATLQKHKHGRVRPTLRVGKTTLPPLSSLEA